MQLSVRSPSLSVFKQHTATMPRWLSECVDLSSVPQELALGRAQRAEQEKPWCLTDLKSSMSESPYEAQFAQQRAAVAESLKRLEAEHLLANSREYDLAGTGLPDLRTPLEKDSATETALSSENYDSFRSKLRSLTAIAKANSLGSPGFPSSQVRMTLLQLGFVEGNFLYALPML